MRFFLAAATVMAFLTMPVYAQWVPSERTNSNWGAPVRPLPPARQPKIQQKKNDLEERAYRSALDRIPARKQMHDPWQNVRETK
jgi:hypothetical protein